HATIVPIDSILRSCHLTPKFGRQRNATWTAENVLDKCSDFFLNSHRSIYMFQMCDGDFVLEENLICCNKRMRKRMALLTC
ncbi:hypothetical protein JB92DRAFT_2760696, partial [Gautieria morchelliformis]